MVVAAEGQAVPRIARPALGITSQVRCVKPLANGTPAQCAPRAIALKDLQVEALLVRSAAGPAEHSLTILEELERIVVDLIATRKANGLRAKLNEKLLRLIVPGRNPAFPDLATTTVLQHDKNGEPESARSFRGLDLRAVPARLSVGIGVVVANRRRR
jgi:hypothetical protein